MGVGVDVKGASPLSFPFSLDPASDCFLPVDLISTSRVPPSFRESYAFPVKSAPNN
jgi:hypothetical protein